MTTTVPGSGWVCANCGVWVLTGATHTCPTVTPTSGQLVIQRRRRRHITGTIEPKDRAGKQYDVDLWVEDVP